jgi:nucleolar complex protein 3
VARLAMLSLAAVFRDILPGYRVRLPTEKELAVAVSKEVKKLREYESALLRAYQVCSCCFIFLMSFSMSCAILLKCTLRWLGL